MKTLKSVVSYCRDLSYLAGASMTAGQITKRQPVKKSTLCIGAGVILASTPALAQNGGEELFKESYDSSIGAIQGYGAKLATGVSGAFAMIGSVFKFQPQLVMSTLGVGFTGASIDNAIDFTSTMTI